PPKRYVVVQSLETAPRFASRGDVDQSEKNPGHELQKEYGECSTTENVKPARRVSWHRVFGRFANRSCDLLRPVQPFSNLCRPAHGVLFPVRAALIPGVGSSPACMVTKPFSILCGYSKSPRSGGPEAREPSR